MTTIGGLLHECMDFNSFAGTNVFASALFKFKQAPCKTDHREAFAA